MSGMQTAPAKPSAVSRALARDRLGVPAVLFFVLAGVAPLTVAAGVIPTAYATTGLTGIPAAFLIIAVVLALFATGYVAMTRHITNAGAFYKAHMFARTCVRWRRKLHGFELPGARALGHALIVSINAVLMLWPGRCRADGLRGAYPARGPAGTNSSNRCPPGSRK
jgi:hypothetical protein